VLNNQVNASMSENAEVIDWCLNTAIVVECRVECEKNAEFLIGA